MQRITRAVAAGLLCGLVAVGTGRGAVAAGAAPEIGARVDLNSASADELAQLPGIGPAKAEEIVRHRAEEPFRQPEDLRKVKGIGDKLYDRLKEKITVGAPETAPKGRGS